MNILLDIILYHRVVFDLNGARKPITRNALDFESSPSVAEKFSFGIFL